MREREKRSLLFFLILTLGGSIMKSNQKKLRAKQRQSRNMVIVSLMNDTGWSREKVVESLKELEEYNLIKFPEQGGMMLKVGEVR